MSDKTRTYEYNIKILRKQVIQYKTTIKTLKKENATLKEKIENDKLRENGCYQLVYCNECLIRDNCPHKIKEDWKGNDPFGNLLKIEDVIKKRGEGE